MGNKEGWKEIEQYTDNRKAEMMYKYKIDINENLGQRVQRYNKNKKIIKKLIAVIVMILIYNVVYSIYGIYMSQNRKESLRASKEIAVATDIIGNGCYRYEIANMPYIEVHSHFVIYKENYFIHDKESRICKYYFEKWQDKDKEKFVVNEHYEDCSGFFYKKKNWILNYQVYIEANSYENAINAIDIILGFKKYVGQNFYTSNAAYIKARENIIVPYASEDDRSEMWMRESIENRCANIFNK